MSEEGAARTPRWAALSEDARAALSGRLAGLYGHADDESAFDSLAEDKRQALLVFARRLGRFGLWRHVGRVTNVYGEGGVGLEFVAREDLAGTLGAHGRFTSRFAGHNDSAGGFFETRRARAALHLLRARGEPARWSAHFDLHGPAAGSASALRHLLHEKIRGRTPDWRAIKRALGYEAEVAGAADEDRSTA